MPSNIARQHLAHELDAVFDAVLDATVLDGLDRRSAADVQLVRRQLDHLETFVRAAREDLPVPFVIAPTERRTA
ncbi:hypothetical protein ACPPVT_07305 [Angustibacter sp. McL0619]|uniref:hypothetical protein n=1 Tax=Angustibacter sp. McL0619 TaxID=3415676 RepID=UPI003CF76C99